VRLGRLLVQPSQALRFRIGYVLPVDASTKTRLPRPGASHHGNDGYRARLDVGARSVERTAVQPPDSGSDGKMVAETPAIRSTEREVPARAGVQFVVAPASRLWTAACMGLGGAFLAAALFRSFGAFLSSFEHLALEALFLP